MHRQARSRRKNYGFLIKDLDDQVRVLFDKADEAVSDISAMKQDVGEMKQAITKLETSTGRLGVTMSAFKVGVGKLRTIVNALAEEDAANYENHEKRLTALEAKKK